MGFLWLYAGLGFALVAWYWARHRRQARVHAQALQQSLDDGLNEPPTLHPVFDPQRCIGSGSCVRACPELAIGIVNGKAVLTHAAHCIGHGACLTACAFDAITLVFGTEKRGVDIPNVGPNFETNVPGLFIAGELGGMGLVRKAVEQGRKAMTGISERTVTAQAEWDVAIVGAGPAGLSAALAAKQMGLRYCVIEQEDSLGGAIYHYPRHKITMTQPMELPLVGKLQLGEIPKEKLLALWAQIVDKHQLSLSFSERLDEVQARPDGTFTVLTSRGPRHARSVLLAIGRRGSPRKLDVPGEELAKVVYRLSDPEQYAGQRVLVVGGGDSALEAALALAEQPRTQVVLSYRSAAFARVKAKNRQRLQQAADAGQVRVLLNSQVRVIEAHHVTIQASEGEMRLDNDHVVICAGGLLPTPMLQAMGIRFDTKYGTV